MADPTVPGIPLQVPCQPADRKEGIPSAGCELIRGSSLSADARNYKRRLTGLQGG
jgi:hypothetical protein